MAAFPSESLAAFIGMRTQSEGKHIFTIRGIESQKLISHAKSIIAGSYGNAAHIQVA